MNLAKKTANFFFSKINIDLFSKAIMKCPFLLPFYKIGAQKMINYEYPRHIFIETTSICNLRCKMCPRNISPIKLGLMDTEIFKKIINEAALYGPRSFSLHLFGEPFCDPLIKERIAYIKKTNPENAVLITTNGVLMNQSIAEELVKNKVDKIFVSIHSPDKTTYQKITGRDFLETVEQNILDLINLKKKLKSSKPKISLRLIKIKENAQEIKSFQKKWRGLPIQIEIRESHNYGGKIKETLRQMPKKRHPCYHLWFAPGISWDGDVSICCDDVHREAVLGNIKESKLADIWKGETLTAYRQYHLQSKYHKISLCKNCDVWQIYPDIFFKRQKK